MQLWTFLVKVAGFLAALTFFVFVLTLTAVALLWFDIWRLG